MSIWHSTTEPNDPLPHELHATIALARLLALSPQACIEVVDRFVIEEFAKLPPNKPPNLTREELGGNGTNLGEPAVSVRSELLIATKGFGGRADLSICLTTPAGRQIQLVIEAKGPATKWREVRVPKSLSTFPEVANAGEERVIPPITLTTLAQPAAYGAIWSEIEENDETLRVIGVLADNVDGAPPWIDQLYEYQLGADPKIYPVGEVGWKDLVARISDPTQLVSTNTEDATVKAAGLQNWIWELQQILEAWGAV